jgi:phosphate transport system substrate-binding protein
MIFQNKYSLRFVLLACIVFQACGSERSGQMEADTPTTGTLNIGVEHSDSPALVAQINLFQSLYPKSELNASFLPQNRILELMMNDSLKTAVMHRDLSAAEKNTLQQAGINARSTLIGYAGIALVSARLNPIDTNAIFINDLKALFTGLKGGPQLIFDHASGACFSYFRDSLCGGVKPGPGVKALNSNSEVLNYVMANPGCIGVIGANWVGDMTSETARSMFRQIRILPVRTEPEGPAYKPFYAHVKLKKYPLRYGIYMINTQHYQGLGSGFITFVGGAQGQLALKKSGIVPVRDQERIIQIHNGLPEALK